MIKSNFNVIGVMSGTSLDGIDLAYISFAKAEKWSFKIYYSQTISYSKKWIKKLENLTLLKSNELKQIDFEYTCYLAQVITEFINNNNLKNIDAICSHGHTALHQPENSYTYQIGNHPDLSKKLKQTIVCDFRVQDVKLGGQGAPLVPIGDQLLFQEYDYCINLGGFANVSLQENANRIAFDVCPVNIVLNKYVKLLGHNYDDKGKIAMSGQINHELLDQLNHLSFYKKKHPKSLGLEWVEAHIFPLINSKKDTTENILRTFTEHVAIQISHILKSTEKTSVLMTGGGVYNSFLIERIESLSAITLTIPSKELIEFKEALIFGFLGVLKLRGDNNCLASVTGAKKNHSSGVVFFNN